MFNLKYEYFNINKGKFFTIEIIYQQAKLCETIKITQNLN